MKVNVGDNSYYVEVTGKGEPVIMFHGFTGSLRTWDLLVNYLSEHFQCITVDLPGHGQTNADVTDMEQACRELKQIIQEVTTETFNLLGYSMGGRTALVFAHQYPESVKRLILESASPGLDGDEKNNRQLRDEKLATYIEENGIEEFVNYWETIPLFQTQESLPDSVKQEIRRERLSQTESGLALSLRTMGTGVQLSMWQHLNNLNLPVFLISGELDRKFVNLNQQMDDEFPTAIHTTVSNVGHAIHLENPDFFGKIVMKHLNNYI
ncbi:2-succinyl-6-hydroxy-2,4-cyclohexadiene-1-carboxylate synthase [Aquisalibacillus elongatus]|uniref:Putative 2-succinyl-6-hydroxy-2,4-cyclohexadiene-1-carboxylate synthase n=1 Tax=Aquisalibacillus elongatus TaxID=485577 RepID=A0A3N5BS10_9BACI|nr:2-succinyl-6-hydroxy-2,4-cyclohexadiene-1-carboxylate synthase [Aquisalibacillus elongatus]RPF50282.1 2-succinyl-6-hydroxy-2,4-cyclohexadiene-1-carboxylate synthase [Aquisalibacillus elongatus]